MAKLVQWRNPKVVKERLAKRLRTARDHRKRLVEDQWKMNERTVYNDHSQVDAIQAQVQEAMNDTEDFDLGDEIEINYAFKNLRFLHAQLSSNPPVATPRAESPDLEDSRAAAAADQCMKYFLRQLFLQETVDRITLDTLVYGTGVLRTGWNPDAGDIIDFDADSEELTLEGEIEAVRVSPWKILLDPSAERQEEIRYIFEEIELSEEEVKSRFPTKWHLFRARKRESSGVRVDSLNTDGTVLTVDSVSDTEEKFTVYAYFEPGLPENGMLGRFCYCFDDGTLLTPPTTNPNIHRPSPSLEERTEYRRTGTEPPRRPGTAYLPYLLLTDIDVPGQVWGRSFLQYAGPAQNLMRSIDSATLEAVKAHGVARLVLPPGAKLAADSIGNSSYQIVQLDDPGPSGMDAKFIPPPGLPSSMAELRNLMRLGVDDMAGVNESMFGQMSRETPATGMQYAVNQGSMIRRRLFNKYVLLIEGMYKALLRLAIQHWDEDKMIRVLGDENAFDSVELRGIDIDGGYEIVTEYGTHLPLDPMARRDEMMKYLPIWKEAGLDPKVFAANLKLAEFDRTTNVLQLSQARAKEMVDVMVATGQYVEPRQGQDYVGMLAYCKTYVMTSEFFGLEEERKVLVEKYMTDLASRAAAEAAPAPGALPGAPGAIPMDAAAAMPPVAGTPPPLPGNA